MNHAEHYVPRVQYAAPIETAFRAAAAPGGDGGWWTTRGDTVTGAGELVRLNWSATDYVIFRVDAFEPPTAMHWTCVAQHDPNLPQPDEWVGTALDFRFERTSEDATDLRFAHEGLAPGLDCYTACERGWEFFLRTSIRGLAERGAGVPHDAGPDVTARAFDDMEAAMGGVFRRARAELGVTSFGLQVIDLPPGFDEPYAEHAHAGNPAEAAFMETRQEEVYVPLAGRGRLLAGGQAWDLVPGMAVRIGAAQRRNVVTGAEPLRYLAIGGVPGEPFVATRFSELGGGDDPAVG